ncbi:acyl carrier protein 3, mitochondrial-like [Chenopodium quinoa]|uniref:Acyl carrier protein n=1 Tax=Chenopodium quinoa TaxID=63459 RepID=A0A803M1I5_CHEQI|nr:acyl carrier protein 3, mitochondrial-like [Chenopodium quinoa]
MQSIKSSILRHFRLHASFRTWSFNENASLLNIFNRQLCTTTGYSDDQIMDRVIGLVKKFNKTDTTKVTETTNFQKDLCLDSLERVELVMAFEQEFSIEIPEEKADKLTCCADVAKYILDETKQSAAQNN